MTFSEKMNEYIELIGCSAKELSDASLISPAVISRYRNGERVPKYPSVQFNALVAGIYILSKDKNIDLKQDVIKEDLLETLDVLIDGPFVMDLKSYECKYRGSSNQRVIDLQKTKETGELVLLY